MSPIGIDTSFLVAVETTVHDQGFAARELLDRFGIDGDTLALNPDVLSEFVHVVTDPKRFNDPLTMDEAVRRARVWWSAKDIAQVFPALESTILFMDWITQHRLGRKRLRDTMLAASYFSAGVTRIVTLNAKDFRVFGCFEIIEPAPSSPPA